MRRKFFSSIRPGLPSLRFGYLATYVNLNFRTTGGELITMRTSDGSNDNFRNQVSRGFPDANLKESSITISNTNSVDILSIDSPNVTYLNGPTGTANFSAYPNLLICRLTNSLCTKFIAKAPISFEINNTQAAGKVLNLAGVNAADIRVNQTFCDDIVWPLEADYISLIQLSGHALAKPQTLTRMPNLQYLYMEYTNAAPDQGVTDFDVTRVLNLGELHMRQARVNGFTSIAGQSIRYINCIFNDFSKTLNGVPGRPESFVELIKNSRKLAGVDGFNCGMSRANQVAIFDEFITNEASRTKCYFNFAYGNLNDHWHLYSGAARAPEALVRQQDIIKYNYFVGLSNAMSLSDLVFDCVVLSETQAELTLLNADDDITVFGVGSSISCNVSFNPDLFPYGPHNVLSGSGKVWLVENLKPVGGFIGARGRVQILAIT